MNNSRGNSNTEWKLGTVIAHKLQVIEKKGKGQRRMPKRAYSLLDMGQRLPPSQAGTTASASHTENCISGNIRIMVPTVISLFLCTDILFVLKMCRMHIFFYKTRLLAIFENIRNNLPSDLLFHV